MVKCKSEYNKPMKLPSFSTRIPITGFLADFAVIALILFRDNFKFILEKNLYIPFLLAGIFQVLAIHAILLSPNIFNLQASKSKFLSTLQNLSSLFLVLSIGGFIWFYFPAEIIGEPWGERIMLLNMFIILFGGPIAWALVENKTDPRHLNWLEKLNKNLSPILFLTISELLILSYASQQQEIGFILLMIIISYLPIRILLIAKPPFNILEIFTALTALGFFIMEIL